jgi:four helix bundle protein
MRRPVAAALSFTIHSSLQGLGMQEALAAASRGSTPSIRSHRDLHVWQKAVRLVEEVYRLTSCFPTDERYGLTSQTRRAAVSIAGNIAEGHGRDHLGDYLHHLSMANGSVAELESHLLIAHTLSFVHEIDLKPALRLCDDISRMLSGLSSALIRRTKHPRAPRTTHHAPQ